MNLAIKNETELKGKYQGVNVEKIINSWISYFNSKPFQEQFKRIWIEEIKDFLFLENLNYSEIIEEEKINNKKRKEKKTKKEEVPKEKKTKKEEVPKEIEENYNQNLKLAYDNIIKGLKEYVDLKEEYYNIIALWIIGTYFHDKFPNYPFLFFNAQKGSGKSRIMNLITFLSKNGSVMNNMTEAVLFRTKGTLAIDEYEGVNRKGNENLRELLNSSYKKGTKVKRMKQQKTMEGVEQVVEEFDVYRPIIMANIWGMENVLGDRCITLILEKSNKKEIVNLMEIFSEDSQLQETKKLLNWCSLCRCSFSAETYKEWNAYIKSNYTNYINNTNNTNYTKYTQLFKSINLMDLNGRELELSFPLCLIAQEIEVQNSEILKITTLTLKEIFCDKRAEELVEDRDVSLIDFISQEAENNVYQINTLTENFKQFLGVSDDWINSKWMGRALKRLNLIKEKRRVGRGVQVKLNIEKAQEKIKFYK